MNSFNGIGRLTRDVELKYAQSGTAIARFTIAINRPFKNANGEQEADFLNCVAFGKRAEVIAEYVKKGQQIGITGSVQTGSYEKDGKRVYTTDINVSGFTFLESRNSSGNPNSSTTKKQNEFSASGAEPIDIQDSDLPF